MKRFFASFALIALLLVPALAWAHGHGHVMGTIAVVAADHVEVTKADGKMASVPIHANTKFMRGSAHVVASDLAVGMRVSVHLAADGSAELIKLPTEKKKTTPKMTH